jgi:urease subunit alpha
MVGDSGATLGSLFVSRLAVERGDVTALGLRRPIVAIRSVRSLSKADMVRNDALPRLEVDATTFVVSADGVPLRCPPAASVPLSTRYLLR